MKAREAGSSRPSSIQWRLMLIVVPISAVTLLAGLFLVWILLSVYNTSTWTTATAIAIAVAAVGIVAGTLFAVYRSSRSITRRIEDVTVAARRVANRDLVDLLDALRNPEIDVDSIAPMNLDSDAPDEVGDLARSFEELHRSLVEVGARQMETLRAGVSSIFATLARRNSSLVDRQIALLDELESGEEDPEVLGGFYQVDHLATRMRRNAESLLVLAGSESPRVWAKAADLSDVVRGAVGEIDEYHRIELLAFEPARISGAAVTDVTHLIAELLDNAIQFSPPSERIRVTGLFDTDGYQLAISDRGVGMTEARVAEMNRILDRPPALGLSVEPTLGLYVVAKLAHRHGLQVSLVKGVPGVTAKISIPRDHLEITDNSESRPWDADHTERMKAERTRAAMPTAEYDDAESRAYVQRRTREQAGVSAERNTENVIDLTHPVYREPIVAAPSEDLPVRTPGQSFGADDDGLSIVSSGEDASQIRSALSAYEAGRRSAVEVEEPLPDSSTESDSGEQT